MNHCSNVGYSDRFFHHLWKWKTMNSSEQIACILELIKKRHLHGSERYVGMYLGSVLHAGDVIQGNEATILVSAYRLILLLKQVQINIVVQLHDPFEMVQTITALINYSQLANSMGRLGEVIGRPHDGVGGGLVAGDDEGDDVVNHLVVAELIPVLVLHLHQPAHQVAVDIQRRPLPPPPLELLPEHGV